MSAEIDDGGPAFPMSYHPDGNNADHQGMTLRDWLAAHATEQDIEEHRNTQYSKVTGWPISSRTREAAKYAYADEMIRTRKGGTDANR
jgi:hypothetical protein